MSATDLAIALPVKLVGYCLMGATTSEEVDLVYEKARMVVKTVT
jgi:hypothetical protein